MAKNKFNYICNNCNYETVKWLGKCPDCNQWNTLSEEITNKIINHSSTNSLLEPRPINSINLEYRSRIETGLSEFDRVVGGGITVGSLCLIGGEPGIGKSTLLLEVCNKISKRYNKDLLLYVSAEESGGQIAGRAKRLGIDSTNILLLNENNITEILKVAKKKKPLFLVLDSIQTLYSPEVQSASGSPSQVRDVTYEVMNFCKANEITCFIIGHVTKEGNIAGPKLLEHMVDTVIYFESDDFNHLRMLRVIKNRFGNTNELGIFEMTEKGLEEVLDPSSCFIESSSDNSFGKAISCLLEGSRPLFVEVQALVVENKFGNGRRTTQGIDSNRLSLLVAVIDKYFEIPLSFNDIYANVVGGLKLLKRESDLSVIAALLSSYYEIPIDNNIVFLAEVGLTGEVRSPHKVEYRLKEIEKMNFNEVITSKKIAQKYKSKFNLKLTGIEKASQIKVLFS